MQDYLISMALSILFTVLATSVKNADSKAKMRKAFLKLFIQIRALYADDPDFQ